MSTLQLRARKWSGFICKRASEDTTIALGLMKKEEEEKVEEEEEEEEKEEEEKDERRMPNRDFYFARCVRKIA